MNVALPALPALTQDKLLSILGEVYNLQRRSLTAVSDWIGPRPGFAQCPFVRDPGYRICRSGGAPFLAISSRIRRRSAINHGPDWNLDGVWPGSAPMHFLTLPVGAVPGLDDRLIEKIRKAIGVDIGPQNDVTTPATIATIGPTMWHEFFATKTDAPTPAITRLGKNFYAIDKHAFSGGRRGTCHPWGQLSPKGAAKEFTRVTEVIRQFAGLNR